MKRILTLLTCLFTVLCLTACGKTVEISTEASDITISDYEEISFRIKSCTPDAVTYTVCSSKENFLFYEGHQFAYVQKYVDGSWYSLVQQPQVSTANFIWDSISTEERQETISINAKYGGKLEKGTYRLVAPCSLSATPPDNSELSDSSEQTVDIATEFEID